MPESTASPSGSSSTTATGQPYIGGQAVIEGVMMRAPGCMSVAARRPDGTIALVARPITSKLATSKLRKVPGVRGVATLVESLSLGYWALNWSAERQFEDEEDEDAVQESNSGAGGRIALGITFLIGIGLFKVLPQVGASLTADWLSLDLGVADWEFHALTGAFQLTIFTGYIVGISLMKDIRRTFEYHGAEHKTIFAYEAGLPLTVANVRMQSKLHQRCGTTFLIVVVAVSIVLGSIVVPLVLPAGVEGIGAWLLTLAIRISLLPLIAAISYELQRFSARYCTTGPLRVLLWPGFLYQRITTREPDDRQIEIAIAAMQRAIVFTDSADGSTEDKHDEFDSFDELADEFGLSQAQAA